MAPSGRKFVPFNKRSLSFAEISKKCLQEGTLYEDPEFPAVDSSVFFSKRPPKPFQWKRPPQLCNDPQLFVEGASRFDVKQGELGDCWLLASLACLTLVDELLHQVVPPDQGFGRGYCGAFRFHFWRAGEWIEIVVDDRLPTYNNELKFTRSAEGNEFWSALLEKAYAKLFGSYEFLKGGLMSEGLEDFTGGLAEFFELEPKKIPEDLFEIMMRAKARLSLMGCSITPDPSQVEALLPNGLVCGHAYSLTDVRRIKVRTRKGTQEMEMVRVRNPWGRHEWNGAWSDKSPEWTLLSDKERNDLGLVSSDDGEFWMSFHDYAKNFTNMEICHMHPDATEQIQADASVKKWDVREDKGRWQPGSSAGGCRNFPDTFATNPQFQITLEEADDDGVVPLVVALMQENSRKKKAKRENMLTIGFIVYTLEGEIIEKVKGRKVPSEYFMYNKSTGRSDSYVNGREVVKRFKFPPGTYVIVPSTFNPNEAGEFLLRMYCERPVTGKPMDVKTELTAAAIKPPAIDNEYMQKMARLFNSVAKDDQQIDSTELRQLLNHIGMQVKGHEGFEMEACRSLLALLDDDNSGKLSLQEFTELIYSLFLWRDAFNEHDFDKSGKLDASEMRAVLKALGFKLSDRILNTIVARYSDKNLHIGFAEFVLSVCRLKEAFEKFAVKNQGNKVHMDLEDWIDSRVYV